MPCCCAQLGQACGREVVCNNASPHKACKDGRGLKLTDAGARLRDASTDAFERLRDVCAELTQASADAPFVLGCSGSLLARWLIPRLGRLNADLPDLRLHLSAGDGDLDPLLSAPVRGALG